jgi:hypothetical protein
VKTPSILSAILNSISSLWTQLRVAVQQPIVEVDAAAHHQNIDPDFKEWLHGHPLMHTNLANHYAEDSPGFVTGNGRGSLEIGAAKD